MNAQPIKFALFAMGITVAIAGCDANPPMVSDITWSGSCSDPVGSASIDSNGHQITLVEVNWGRTLDIQASNLYATDPINPSWGGPYSIRRPNGNDILLPNDGNIDLRFTFDFASSMAADEKLDANLRVQYEDGNGLQSTFTSTTTYDCEASTGGGSGGGDPVVGGTPAPVCPAVGLAAPTLDPDPGSSHGPIAGDMCAGFPYYAGTNSASVEFSWIAVTGAVEDTKEYQIEIVNSDLAPGATCVASWSPTGPVILEGSAADCLIADTNTNSFSQLLTGDTNYAWRARATCVAAPGAARVVGPFSTPIAFKTRGPLQKVQLQSPTPGQTISTASTITSTTVNFQWDPLPCGATSYFLTVVGSSDLPADGSELSPDQLPTVAAASGLGTSVMVDGNARIQFSVLLPTNDSYGWWVYAQTAEGQTPVLTSNDARTFTLGTN